VIASASFEKSRFKKSLKKKKKKKKKKKDEQMDNSGVYWQ